MVSVKIEGPVWFILWLLLQVSLLVFSYAVKSLPWWVMWFPSLVILAFVTIVGIITWVVD